MLGRKIVSRTDRFSLGSRSRALASSLPDIVWALARFMISDVVNRYDLWKMSDEGLLDTPGEGRLRRRATLTPSGHPDKDHLIRIVDELDLSPMGSDRGVDLLIENPLDFTAH